MYCKKCHNRLSHGCCILCGTAGNGSNTEPQPQKGGISKSDNSNSHSAREAYSNTQGAPVESTEVKQSPQPSLRSGDAKYHGASIEIGGNKLDVIHADWMSIWKELDNKNKDK